MQYSQHAFGNRASRAAQGSRRFRPGVAPTLVVLALLPLLVWLGTWQLSRAEEKRTLLAAAEARRAAEPQPVAVLEGMPDPAYTRVRLQGRFDASHTFLLDNRTRNGQAGVEVVQPFHDQASGLWLLVNRGWVAWPDRRVPPAIATPSRPLLLDAWVYVAPPGGLHLADHAGQGWPRLLTQIEPAALWAQLGTAGVPLELRLEAGDAAFDTSWPVVAMAPERHTGYAVQWFALATALLCLYLYLGIRRARENNDNERKHDHE
ncbi:SURF1 family protein [compost metagenome]